MYTYARVTNCPAAHNAPPRHAQTNAKLGAYIGYDVWNLTSNNGTTIKDALDYAITLPAGKEAANELWPNILAVGSIYGYADGKYAEFMLQRAGRAYPADAQFLWNQPFSDSGLVQPRTSGGASTDTGVRQQDDNGALAFGASWNTLAVAFGAAILALFA